MKAKYILLAPLSLFVGLFLLGASNSRTMMWQPVGPYQSQSTLVEVPVPEPTKSILFLAGILLSLGAPSVCVYKGFESKKVEGSFQEEEIDTTPELELVGATSRRPSMEVDREESVITGRSQSVSASISTPPRAISYEVSYRTPSKDDLTKYVDEDLCRRLAKTNQSILLASPTGAGKSTLIEAFLVKLIEAHPKAEIHIVDRKDKDWMGLRDIPGLVVAPTLDDYSPLVDKVTTVAELLEDRKDRRLMVGDPNCPPVWLILDDYFSLYMGMANVLSKEAMNKLIAYLLYILTVGREYNVMLLIITQSPNAEDIGFSASIRNNAGFLCLGRINKEKEDGGFKAIKSALAKANLIEDPETRAELSVIMRKILKPCEEQGRGMFLSTIGRERIGVVPDLSWVKGYRFDIGSLAKPGVKCGSIHDEHQGDWDTPEED